jgi:hypothetical protein
LRDWKLTRLETWATPGIPDVLLLDEAGCFHLIELKFTDGNAVSLRPHQVSFLSTHKLGKVWLLVKQQRANQKGYRLYLYGGDSAVNVAMDGLRTGARCIVDSPVDWEKLFEEISPQKNFKI